MAATAVPPPTTAAAAPARDSALVSALEARNATFTTLLSLIPQQYYVAPTDEEMDSRWMKNKKRKTGEEIKEHKRRTKLEKLDPENLPAAEDAAPSNAETVVLPPALPAARPFRALPPAASIAELHDRMRERLDKFAKARGVDETDPQSRDALEAARRQKRGEMRDKRRKDRKEERKKAREVVSAKPAKTTLLVPQSREDGGDGITLPAVALPSSSKKHLPLKKLSNASQALAHLEKHNAKLAALPEDKRKEREEAERWAKAEARAAGTKMADDEKVLKKAVKREEKRKGKSGKEWADRKKTLEQNQAAKIKKRNDNLATKQSRGKKTPGAKGKSSGDSKGKGGSSSGGGKKGRPGFEGKSKSGKSSGGGDKKKRAQMKA